MFPASLSTQAVPARPISLVQYDPRHSMPILSFGHGRDAR
jgi:hypothetical protein